MKLELKHLSPYLPYGLKLQFIFKKEKIFFLSAYDEFINGEQTILIDQALNGYYKPILRPISDLEGFNPAIYNYLVKNCENYVARLQQIDYNVLIENRFDVFGLIEKELAIDINSVPQISE